MRLIFTPLPLYSPKVNWVKGEGAWLGLNLAPALAEPLGSGGAQDRGNIPELLKSRGSLLLPHPLGCV